MNAHKLKQIFVAAENMDWTQVVLNGGPPCFHIDKRDLRFCGRAARWAGHGEKNFHDFVPLDQLIKSVSVK